MSAATFRIWLIITTDNEIVLKYVIIKYKRNDLILFMSNKKL